MCLDAALRLYAEPLRAHIVAKFGSEQHLIIPNGTDDGDHSDYPAPTAEQLEARGVQPCDCDILFANLDEMAVGGPAAAASAAATV